MTESSHPQPSGIGGWLILVVLGLVVSPIRILLELGTVHWPMIRDGTWAVLTTPGSEHYHPLWGPLLVFELAGQFGVLLLGAATLWNLVRKSRHTPTLAIVWLGSATAITLSIFLALPLIPAGAARDDPEALKGVLKSLVSAAIWIPYFLKSVRVKNTFVR